MDQDRHHPVGLAAEPDLLRPHATHGHGVHRLEVTGVGDQVDLDVAAHSRVVGAGGALVVLHVARPQDAPGVDVLEAGEELPRRPVDDIEHDVQPAAMTHGDDHLLGLAPGGPAEALHQERDEGRQSLDGEALVADVPGLQQLLEGLGPDQVLEDVAGVELRRIGLHALRHPRSAVRIGDVHELGGQGAAVPGPGLLDTFALGGEVGVGLGLEAPEPVEIGLQIAPAAVGVEDSVVRHGTRAYRHACGGAVTGTVLPRRPRRKG